MKATTRLPYGEGSFSKRSDGLIIFRKTVHYNNEATHLCVYGRTEKDCMEKMRKKEFEVKEASHFTSNELLGEALLEWVDTVKKNTVKKQSYDRLRSTAKQIGKADIGHKYIHQVKTQELQEYIQQLVDKNYAWDTIKKPYDMLNDYYRYVSARDDIKNPMLLVTMPRRSNIKVESRQIQWFDQDDIDKFVEACGTRFHNGKIRFKYGYALAANIYLGLRGGELLTIQWKDVDFDAGTVYICKTLIEARDQNGKTTFTVQHSTKRDKNRYVPINSKAKDLLQKHYEVCQYKDPDDYVISTSNRKTNTLKNLSDMIGAIEEMGGTKVRAHNTHLLRHTCASLYFKAGVPIEMICAILGNTREVCEKTYVHFVEEQLKTAASRMIPAIEL